MTPSPIPAFLDRAEAGHPVYITDVRRAFEALPKALRFDLGLELTLPDESLRRFVVVLPRFDAAVKGPARTFIEEYFLAEIYNRLSALGPRELEMRASPGVEEAQWLYERGQSAFGLGLARSARRGYGRAVNVLERMVDTLDNKSGSSMQFRFTRGPLRPDASPLRGPKGAVAELAQRALAGVADRVLLGVDVGGSDIKLALSIDGRLAALKEYDWFPARFTRIPSLTDPVDNLVALMRLQAVALGARGKALPALAAVLAPAFAPEADDATLHKALADAAPWWDQTDGFLFDGVGLSFPDVVVKDKIVGGEVYKTRGIRDNPALDYEAEFRTLTALDDRLRAHVKSGGVVATVNDGPMAAFTALVEAGLADPARVADGIFAHTLGTELGTGWVTEAGDIPDLPLEIYNFIIDLGSYPERRFPCDDPRSVRNFNTDLPGTLQKYTSQSGAFRLALRTFPTERIDLMGEILERGFVLAGAAGLSVPTEPKDMRKPFLEYLMSLPDRDDHPAVNRVFTEIGEYLAVASLECDSILRPAAHTRILFGRMVKNAACFRLMQEGARSIDPTLSLVPAADDLAVSGLMKELKADGRHTVAQFAQAVGSVYYAASRLGGG